MDTAYRPISSGRCHASLSTGYFRLTEASYPAGYAVPPHGHATASITFVIRGRLEEHVAGRSERFGPRGLLLKPAAVEHSNRFGDAGARLLLVEVLPVLAGTSRTAAEVLRHVRPAAHPRFAALMHRVRREMRASDDCAELAIEGMLLELLASLGRHPDGTRRPAQHSAADPSVERVRERLVAEFARPLRITELAAAEDISPARLSRGFRARFGRGIGEYLRQLRLDWAASALARSDLPISTIARNAGFADQSHLTREFHSAFGSTPAAFRRAAREPRHSRHEAYRPPHGPA